MIQVALGLADGEECGSVCQVCRCDPIIASSIKVRHGAAVFLIEPVALMAALRPSANRIAVSGSGRGDGGGGPVPFHGDEISGIGF